MIKKSDTISIPINSAPNAGLVTYEAVEPSQKPQKAVVWVHGGGFVGGSATQAEDYFKVLAAETGSKVFSVDYSLAPEQTHPTQIRQTAAALQYVQAHAAELNIDPNEVFVGGDSAGAVITTELAGMLADPAFAQQVGLDVSGIKQPKGLILEAGFYDAETVGATGAYGIDLYMRSETGLANWHDYAQLSQLSAVDHVTPDYPPVFITASNDAFSGQSHAYEAVLRANDVPATAVYTDGPHETQFDLTQAPGQLALAGIVKFMNDPTA